MGIIHSMTWEIDHCQVWMTPVVIYQGPSYAVPICLHNRGLDEGADGVINLTEEELKKLKTEVIIHVELSRLYIR